MRKSVLICALCLFVGVAMASAAPAPVAAPSAPAIAQADNPPAPEQIVADACDASPFAETVFASWKGAASGLDPSTCGSCSQNPCKLAGVGSVCGIQSGKPKYCQDYLASTCNDGGAICRCSNAPIP